MQPIKFLWAYIKGNIRRSYSSSTTLAQFQEKLSFQFESLLSTEGFRLVESLIEAVDNTIVKFQTEILNESDSPGDRDADYTESESSLGDSKESDSELDLG